MEKGSNIFVIIHLYENQFPDLITSDSLTQHVGGNVKEGFDKVEHEVPLQSLQDVFNFDELEEFDKRIKKVVPHPKYVCELKIDGLSVSLYYKDGVLTPICNNLELCSTSKIISLLLIS